MKLPGQRQRGKTIEKTLPSQRRGGEKKGAAGRVARGAELKKRFGRPMLPFACALSLSASPTGTQNALRWRQSTRETKRGSGRKEAWA